MLGRGSRRSSLRTRHPQVEPVETPRQHPAGRACRDPAPTPRRSSPSRPRANTPPVEPVETPHQNGSRQARSAKRHTRRSSLSRPRTKKDLDKLDQRSGIPAGRACRDPARKRISTSSISGAGYPPVEPVETPHEKGSRQARSAERQVDRRDPAPTAGRACRDPARKRISTSSISGDEPSAEALALLREQEDG